MKTYSIFWSSRWLYLVNMSMSTTTLDLTLHVHSIWTKGRFVYQNQVILFERCPDIFAPTFPCERNAWSKKIRVEVKVDSKGLIKFSTNFTLSLFLENSRHWVNPLTSSWSPFPNYKVRRTILIKKPNLMDGFPIISFCLHFDLGVCPGLLAYLKLN